MTDGHKKALELIAENKRTHSPFLNLGNLGLTEIPEEVFECVWLEHLSLGTQFFLREDIKEGVSAISNYIRNLDNRYGSVDVKSIENRPIILGTKLEVFVRVERRVESESNLNRIFKIDDSIAKLEKLKSLIINGNKLNNISFIRHLPSIRYIDFRHNRIKTLHEYVVLLDMNFTWKLKKEALKGFPLFQSNNQVVLEGNPLSVPPPEILEKGKKEILTFLSSVNKPDKKTTNKPLNQAKVILIGDGGAGKTSLLNNLMGLEFDEFESQTHGINIQFKDLIIGNEIVKVKFWDFGGQEVMHGTHSFFFSKRSIYILVLDSRREGKEDYWLKNVESFGGNSPIIIVLNKIDENPSFDVNRSFLQQKYPNICAFFRVSCATGEGTSRILVELEKQISTLEMRLTPFASSWFAVKDALDNMKDDFISYELYYSLCREHELEDEQTKNVLLDFLHDLGVVLAFRKLELHDTQVINPLWLTNAVYRIINSKLVAGKKGYLHLSDLDVILNDPTYAHVGFKYPRNKFLYIVKIMQEFELCYRIAEDVFIVPDLLTVEEQPVPGFDYAAALRFVLQYDFLPASVLPRFMVQLHTRIVEGEQWRTGAALTDPIFKSKAVVKADRDEKRLYLWVNGPDRDNRRNFFNFIRKTLHDIHNSFEKLTVTELVPVPGHDDIFIEYAELVGYEEMGLADYPVGKLRRKFNVEEMLSGLEAPERRQPRRHAPVKVFVSYSHKDAEYKDELVTALAYLARMEEIELWQDGRIEAGMEWRKEIFEKLAEAEIVICLVSSNFIASDFCYSIELKEALEGHEAGTKIVVPIQIKTCAWTKLPFGKIQGLPSKPISSFKPRDDGWGEVFAGMEGAVKRVREKR